jgi:hypothetical protein
MKFLKIISVASIFIILFQASGQPVQESNSSKIISTTWGEIVPNSNTHSFAYYDSIVVTRILSELKY